MKVTLFNFAKKENSTARPQMTAGTEYDCYLKDGTSVVDPVIVLDLPSKSTFTKYTYAYIEDFGRYYFVRDMTADGLLWDVSLVCDVLATYKTEIGSSSMYVLRSAAAYDGRIIDTFYPIMTYHTDVNTTATNPMNGTTSGIPSVGNGMFIIGVVGSGQASTPNAYGSILYYGMRQSALYRLLDALMNDAIVTDEGFDFDEMSQALQKSIIDPLSFIKSCMWLPVSDTDVWPNHPDPMNAQSVHVFDWTFSLFQTYPLKAEPPQVTDTVELAITAHPQASTKGSYLNVEPFTKIQLVYPPFGAFELDTAALSNQSAVVCETFLDLITGIGILRVKGKESGKILINTKSQIGVDIQLAQITKDYVSSAMQGVAAASDAWKFNFGGAAENAIGSAVAAYKPLVSTVGGSGGFSELNGKVELQQTFFYQVDEDNSHAGRPLCEIRTLSSLSGYQQIMDGDIPINGTAGEQAAIKAYLESGYFYE